MAENEEDVVVADKGGNWGAETIPLSHPISFKGVSYRGVALRVPSGADVIHFYEGSPRPSVVDFTVRLLQSEDGTPIDKLVFAAMNGRDVSTIIKKASTFLGDAQ